MSDFTIISWREARSSICRLVTGTEVQAPNIKLGVTHSFLSYRVQILHESSYEKCQNVPAIHTQKDQKCKKKLSGASY